LHQLGSTAELGLWCKISETGDHGKMSRLVPVEELFAGRHFDAEIVVLCVRWYLSFKLSYRDLVSIMSERGIGLAHTTILRWGAALHAGIREAVEAVRPPGGRLLADG
jgi:hypothetical protein